MLGMASFKELTEAQQAQARAMYPEERPDSRIYEIGILGKVLFGRLIPAKARVARCPPCGRPLK